MITAIPINRVLFEVYETDEENYIPYEPNMGESDTDDNKDKATEENTDEEEEEDTAEVEEDKENFVLHMGEILKKFFYTSIVTLDFNTDYADMGCSGSITLPYSYDDLKQCYLGVRCRISSEWITDSTDFNIKEMPETFLGFITDESFNNLTNKLGLSGMVKCMEKKYEFEFSQMQISKIMEEVIKTAGLEPVVNFEGLEDQVIDFSTASSSEDSDSDDGGDTSNVAISTDIKALAKKICKGKKKPVQKAEAIWRWMHDNLKYEYYYNSHKSAVGVLQSGGGNCVDHAKLYYALGTAVGLKVGFVNVGCLGGHVYNGININGQIYSADASVKSVSAFNQTKSSCPRVTASNIRYDWSMWGN